MNELEKQSVEFLEHNGIKVYYYEDKPYRVLHEGKVKSISIIAKLDKTIYENNETPQIGLEEMNREFEAKGVKWIDVVIYEPLYEECDIRICVKEKEDFYNNYKPKD